MVGYMLNAMALEEPSVEKAGMTMQLTLFVECLVTTTTGSNWEPPHFMLGICRCGLLRLVAMVMKVVYEIVSSSVLVKLTGAVWMIWLLRVLCVITGSLKVRVHQKLQ